MATKLECDRCGEMVEKKNPVNDVSPITISYIKKFNDNGYKINHVHGSDYFDHEKTKDLCSSCQKLILDIFNEVLPSKGLKDGTQ